MKSKISHYIANTDEYTDAQYEIDFAEFNRMYIEANDVESKIDITFRLQALNFAYSLKILRTLKAANEDIPQ